MVATGIILIVLHFFFLILIVSKLGSLIETIDMLPYIEVIRETLEAAVFTSNKRKK